MDVNVEQKRRRAYRAIVTKKINDLNEELDNGAASEMLEVLLTQLRGANANLESANEQIMDLLLNSDDTDEETLTAEVNSVQQYRDNVTKVEVLATRAIRREESDATIHCVTSNNHTRLPKLNLPTFSGDVLQYQSFSDSFSASIDAQKIAPVEKFSYLRGQLKGEASKAIEGLALTNENYAEAMDILKTRFGRP